MLIKYTFGSKSQTLRMRYPFQSTGRPISHRNGWSFRVYMIPLRDFVPEWNSRPGARTGVNSRRGDSRRHNILWWDHVNKYRAMRGNQSELAPGRKPPRCHVNTPLAISCCPFHFPGWLENFFLSLLCLPLSLSRYRHFKDSFCVNASHGPMRSFLQRQLITYKVNPGHASEKTSYAFLSFNFFNLLAHIQTNNWKITEIEKCRVFSPKQALSHEYFNFNVNDLCSFAVLLKQKRNSGLNGIA